MRCVSCGRAVREDAIACPSCGARQPRISEEIGRAAKEASEAVGTLLDRLAEAAKPIAREVAVATAKAADTVKAGPAVDKAVEVTKSAVRETARATTQAAREVKRRAKR